MWGKIYIFVLKLLGWRIENNYPKEIKKAVVVVGPHTSNWDFVIGRMAFTIYGVKAYFLIKRELFIPPLGWWLKYLGGIPVDRHGKSNLTTQAVNFIKESDECFMVFTPEGTRSYNPNWKKGFYHIAQKANVPIYMAYIDYKNKVGGFHSYFETTGDVEKDVAHIKEVLSQYSGRFPENGIRLKENE